MPVTTKVNIVCFTPHPPRLKTNVFLGKFILVILKFFNRHEVHRVQTHTVCTTQIEKNRHKRKINSEFVGQQQGYRHFLNTIVR